MPVRTAIALAALVAICTSPWVGAQSPPAASQQDAENAAIKYLRADAALRQSYALGTNAAASLQKALQSPLDEEDEKLVAAAEEALVEFHHGAALKRCDWAMSIEDGPLANTAHRGAIMELVAVAGMRARLRFRGGDTSRAMSDVLAAMAAARHLSVDGSLASVLFAYRLENLITVVLAQNLLRFSPIQLKELETGLDSLPSGSSLSAALESEKVRRNDFSTVAQGATSRDELIERLMNDIPILKSDRTRAVELVDGCGGSVRGFSKCLNQQHEFYALWAPRFALPPEQFEREYKAQIQELSRTNPVIRVFTPSLPRFRWADAYSQTCRALLSAAIAVRREGPNAVSKYLDPYDRNPFSYVSEQGGFRLESRLRDNGIPLSLLVVPSP